MFVRTLVASSFFLAFVVAGVAISVAQTPPPELPLGTRPEISPPSTQPSSAPRVRVARIQNTALFGGFKRAEQLQKQFAELQQQVAAASKAGDVKKRDEATAQLNRLAEQTREEISAAIAAIARREHIDLVVGEIIYKKGEFSIPDLTPQVLALLNAPVTTAPASQPATAPASAPASAPATRPG